MSAKVRAHLRSTDIGCCLALVERRSRALGYKSENDIRTTCLCTIHFVNQTFPYFLCAKQVGEKRGKV